MKINQYLFLILLSICLNLSAKPHDQAVLERVEYRVEQTVAHGKVPVVIFDLDDTVINTRERNWRILQSISRNPEFESKFPSESEKINRIRISEIKYEMGDTLKNASILTPEVITLIKKEWLNRFFTNEYCRNDQPNKAAVSYTQSLKQKGAKIVYLTGRDTPRMGEGTRDNLYQLRFPMGTSGILLMKPTKEMDDLEFKKNSFEWIRKLGEVVGAFENEPANINAMHAAFPKATAVFLDTIHSNKPIEPDEDITWIRDFRLDY